MPSSDAQPLGSPPPTAPVRATSAHYAAPVRDFLTVTPEEVIGHLTVADAHRVLEATQVQAWEEEIAILREALGAGAAQKVDQSAARKVIHPRGLDCTRSEPVGPLPSLKVRVVLDGLRAAWPPL